MKVMHIEAGRHLYGGAQQVIYLMQGLQQLAVDNLLVCPIDSDVGKAAEGLATVLPVSMKGDLDIGLYFRLKRLIKQHKPDVVHIHSRRGADLWGRLAANHLQVPVICSRRVDNTEPGWFARWKYHGYQHVITISEGIRRVLLAEGVNPQHVTTVHSSVDLSKFNLAPNRKWLNDEFNLSHDDFVIANFAQMIERKGQRMLIENFSKILDVLPQAKLLLFGRGAKKEEYQALVEERGLQTSIKFPGFRSEMPQIMSSVDLVVHPASMEGLGVALLQSAACRKAIVATAAGGIPEIVINQHNGALLSIGDSDGVTNAIIELGGDDNKRHEMGMRGRTLVEEIFSIDAMSKGNLAVYKQVLASD